MNNSLKIEEIISYQEKTLNFLKLELEKEVEAEKEADGIVDEIIESYPEDIFDKDKEGGING